MRRETAVVTREANQDEIMVGMEMSAVATLSTECIPAIE
jgi:hypothetical protein